MHVKLLIDAIMQQTTVLIGQLATAAGIRAPLSGVADQVFVELSRELEAQGVGRRVAADMFGMALRSYQKKLRRLTESRSSADRTLWSVVLEHVRTHDGASKAELLRRFHLDGEREVAAILNDLVGSGLLYRTGQGMDTLYRPTSEVDRRRLAGGGDPETLAPVVWSMVCDEPGLCEAEVIDRTGMPAELTRRALSILLEDGRLRRATPSPGAALHAVDLVVPVGAAHGWEVAVSDHFRAVANAIACKVQSGVVASREADAVGGATLSFDLRPDHPHRERVLGLLSEVRALTNAVWHEVEAHNAREPAPRRYSERVYFYFGQYLQEADTSAEGGDDAQER